jgi:CPA1 family monovalent cation:H+ antiporter
LLRRLHIGRDDHRDHERNARLLATQAALDWLEERTTDGVDDGYAVATLRTLYTARLYRLEHSPAGPDDQLDVDGYDALRLEMIATERAVIMALHDEGRITNDVLRRIEHDLDLEESRVRHG